VAEQPGSGALRFFDTRVGANAFQDAGNAKLTSAFSVGQRDFQLRAGQLVIFPSYVFHEVAPFYGRDARITVATNCWFA
jgi:predicted 2-oxoglutarate/Fe(II)-dependent dioxygenase YbiX